jgi:NADH:ubiquinone oxidoreductase subunit H
LQPLADLIKMLAKEDVMPGSADKWLYLLAPAMASIPAIMTFAVIPFGAPITLFGHTVALQVADLNIGLLFFMALSSIAVYGVALGGWASNSKYALLGSIRGLAQLISYELSMGLSLVPIVMLSGSAILSTPTPIFRSWSFSLWPSPFFSSVSLPNASGYRLICRKRKGSWLPDFIPNIRGCASGSFSSVNI